VISSWRARDAKLQHECLEDANRCQDSNAWKYKLHMAQSYARKVPSCVKARQRSTRVLPDRILSRTQAETWSLMP
jgi:hypothetical protein